MAETFEVATRGVGKPDYTREVSSAIERAGLRLAYNQYLKLFELAITPEIQTIALAAAGYVNCVPADIGKMVVDDGANTAVLVTYDNALRIWRINWLAPVLPGSVITITAGVGGGIALGGAFSPFGWVVPPLAPGGSAHVVDTSTGLPGPYTVTQGYIVSLIAAGVTVSEDAIAQAYVDGFTIGPLIILNGGTGYYENRVLSVSTEPIDPTGLAAHTVDITITNLGGGNLLGGVDVIAILEAIGTPPLPKVKTVRCKSCGHEEGVPQETTRWICPICGQLNIYRDLTKIRGTR